MRLGSRDGAWIMGRAIVHAIGEKLRGQRTRGCEPRATRRRVMVRRLVDARGSHGRLRFLGRWSRASRRGDRARGRYETHHALAWAPPMPDRPTALLWDNDGVLVDTEGLYFQATREVLASVGVEL